MTDLALRVKLAALWAALMFLYLYADFFMLFPQGHLDEIASGKMGPFDVSQTSLFLGALLMAVPALMVALPTLLPSMICRWANIVLGAVYTLVNVGNVVGESWAFYLFYAGLEVVLTITIVVLAYRWRPEISGK